MTVKPVPDTFHTITPYLTVSDAARLIAFLQDAFDARVIESIPGPDGTVRHADVLVGNSHVMMGQPDKPTGVRSAMLYMYVPDVDATWKRAVSAGGEVVHEPSNQFYGDRSGAVRDPVGNEWWIATHVEDVTPEELRRRMEQAKR